MALRRAKAAEAFNQTVDFLVQFEDLGDLLQGAKVLYPFDEPGDPGGDGGAVPPGRALLDRIRR